MKKLQDFAREQGVTDRAIQKHLKKYAAELEGLFERKGPNGTWLSDEACTFLKGKMKQQPLAIFDEDPRIEKLQAELEKKEKQLDEKEKLLAIAQKQVQELLEDAGKVKALEEGRKALEGKIEAIEREKDKIDQEARKAQKEAQETLVSFSNAFEDEKKQREAAEAYAAELEAYLRARDEYERLPFYKRWRTRKPERPVPNNGQSEVKE